MDERIVVKREDLILGNIALGIGIDEFDKLVTGDMLSEEIFDRDVGFGEIVRAYSNGIRTLFTDFHDGRGFILFSLQTTSSEHPTARGLAVGDSVEKIYELYGITLWEIYDGVFQYGTETGDYVQLQIIVEDDKAVRIGVSLIL